MQNNNAFTLSKVARLVFYNICEERGHSIINLKKSTKVFFSKWILVAL